MPRLSNSFKVLILALLFSLAAIPAHADGISNPTYSITGVLILTGNDTCTPAPCSEAIAFSFDLGYQALVEAPQVTIYLANITNATEIWTGDLASFTQSSTSLNVGDPVGTSTGCAGGDVNFIGMFDAGGDEVDLDLCQDAEPTPVVPTLAFGDLFRCQTSTCASDFPSGPATEVGVLEDVTITQQVPEPATVIQLAAGMLALGLLLAIQRQFLARPSSA